MKSGYLGIKQLQQIDPTFNRDDPVLIRYEMIREFRANGRKNPAQVAKRYGYGVTQLYEYDRRFEEEGILGLMERKPGPKSPRKLTPEIEQKVIDLRSERDFSITEISSTLKDEGTEISPKSVDRILNKHGLPKKKPGRKPKTS